MKENREWLIPALIFSGLVLVVIWMVYSHHRFENSRPRLVEVRIVSATGKDPVFREGLRSVGAREVVRLALALRLEYPGREDRWLSPVEELQLDGRSVEHVCSDSWPEEDRRVEAYWFTLESPFVGGRFQSREDSENKLRLRSFAAPEMGLGLMAEREPEWHAEDQVNLGENLAPPEAGTYRLYARVHVLPASGGTHPFFTITTLGPEDVGNPRLVEIRRGLAPDFGLDPVVGECFRLPGFQAPEDVDMEDLTRYRRCVSSETFAAMAVCGRPAMPKLRPGSPVFFRGGAFSTGKKSLRWGKDVRVRDILRQKDHWMVLVQDDGNGILDENDIIARSWKRPPAIGSIKTYFSSEEGPVELLGSERP